MTLCACGCNLELTPKPHWVYLKCKPIFIHGHHGRNVIFSELRRKRISMKVKGKWAWNKGRKGVYSKESLQKMRDIKKGSNNPMYNHVFVESTRKKLSDAAKKRNFGHVGLSLLQKKRITKPEKQMMDILDELHIEYIKEYYTDDTSFPYFADFYLYEYNIIIEVDGTYWHNYPTGSARDTLKDIILSKEGYLVLRFWSTEISKDSVLNSLREIGGETHD